MPPKELKKEKAPVADSAPSKIKASTATRSEVVAVWQSAGVNPEQVLIPDEGRRIHQSFAGVMLIPLVLFEGGFHWPLVPSIAQCLVEADSSAEPHGFVNYHRVSKGRQLVDPKNKDTDWWKKRAGLRVAKEECGDVPPHFQAIGQYQKGEADLHDDLMMLLKGGGDEELKKEQSVEILSGERFFNFLTANFTDAELDELLR